MHKVLIFEGLRLQNYTVDDFVVFFSSVDYETFDILEDEEVIKLLHCGFHCCFY